MKKYAYQFFGHPYMVTATTVFSVATMPTAIMVLARISTVEKKINTIRFNRRYETQEREVRIVLRVLDDKRSLHYAYNV